MFDDDDLVCEGDCDMILDDEDEDERVERELADRYPEWSGSAPTTLKGWD